MHRGLLLPTYAAAVGPELVRRWMELGRDDRAADPDGAQRQVQAALDTYQALDARRDIERLDARTRTVRGLKPQRARPDRPRFGWEALTPTELKVADAVAKGMTNGEVAAHLLVSRHTVESHLKHIFTKLGVRSRTAVAGEVVRNAR